MAMNMASRLHRYKRGWTFLTPLRKQDFSTLINWGRIGESHSGWMTRGPTDSHVWRDIAILRKKQCGSLRAGFRCHFWLELSPTKWGEPPGTEMVQRIFGSIPFESYVFKLIGCLKWAVDPRRSPSLMGFIPDAPRHCAWLWACPSFWHKWPLTSQEQVCPGVMDPQEWVIFLGIYLFPKARVNLEPKIGRSTIWSHSNTRMRICSVLLLRMKCQLWAISSIHSMGDFTCWSIKYGFHMFSLPTTNKWGNTLGPSGWGWMGGMNIQNDHLFWCGSQQRL